MSVSIAARFADIELAPPDAIFHLTASFKADTDPKKVNLGIGAYRDDDGKSWVLPVVKKTEHLIVNNLQLDHEYLPIEGLDSFTSSAAKLIFGADHPAIHQGRVASVQTISGTGAVSLAAYFLHRFRPNATVLLSNPTWANHKAIFSDAGFTSIKDYTYYHPASSGLNLEGMLNDLRNAPHGSIIVLHACAHNPTGVDPTPAQWTIIAQVILDMNHIVLFDCAYQGFASGDVDRDALAVREFANKMELFVAQSFAKNFGLYNERCGNLSVVSQSPEGAKAVRSQLAKLQRAAISNPPAFGARIVSTVLNDPVLYKEWTDNLKSMSGRIQLMRTQLFYALQKLGTPGSWQHILDQIGMFSYTGLTATQSQTMRNKFHVYMPDSGRISMAGLTTKNVDYFAQSFDWVVRNVK